MRRRSFFAAAIAAAAALVWPSKAAATPPLKTIHKYDYATDTWARCRLYDLRAGDVFRADDGPALIADSDPELQPDGVWGIMTRFEIDPATNQWVPHRV